MNKMFFIVTLVLLTASPIWPLYAEDASLSNNIWMHFSGRKLKEKEIKIPHSQEIARAKGDLNNDQVEDLAFLISIESISKPLVLIFLGDKSGNFSYWKLGAAHFIDDQPNFIEKSGLQLFKIEKEILHIATTDATSMGSWSARICHQKWRDDKTGLHLIGLTIAQMDRKCACGTKIDVNYITGEIIRTSDQSKDGEEMARIFTKARKKSPPILWENFDFASFCYAEK
ncbi:MAG: hypothetical protein ACOYK8_09665 [Alphaproteobacteria bacterium]